MSERDTVVRLLGYLALFSTLDEAARVRHRGLPSVWVRAGGAVDIPPNRPRAA